NYMHVHNLPLLVNHLLCLLRYLLLLTFLLETYFDVQQHLHSVDPLVPNRANSMQIWRKDHPYLDELNNNPTYISPFATCPAQNRCPLFDHSTPYMQSPRKTSSSG